MPFSFNGNPLQAGRCRDEPGMTGEGLARKFASAYLRLMAIFPRPVHPRVLVADIRRIWGSSTNRYKLVFGAIAIGVTSLIVTGFILDSRWQVPPQGPQIIYAENFPANRTDEQIRQDQWADARKRRAEAEERQRQWKRVERQLSSFGL
jgi:hypothetical protein